MYVLTQLYVHMYIYIHIRYMYVYIHKHIYIYIYACIYIPYVQSTLSRRPRLFIRHDKRRCQWGRILAFV